MSKEQLPNLGTLICPHCGQEAVVRENRAKKPKLFYLCQSGADGKKGCGLITPNLPAGQEWIRTHMRRDAAPAADPAPAPAPQPDPAAAVATDPAAAPAPAPRRRPRILTILDAE